MTDKDSPTAASPGGPYGDLRVRRDGRLRRVVIYTRTGGLEADIVRDAQTHQVLNCRREAERLGLKVVAEIHDMGVPSGFHVDRPGWQQVLELIHADEIDLIVALDIARITRSWDDVPALIALARDYDVHIQTVAPFRRTPSSISDLEAEQSGTPPLLPARRRPHTAPAQQPGAEPDMGSR